MKIGILGGTFDPIHEGHIALAKAAVSELELDKVLFIPAGNPYFKSGKRDILPGIHRFNMIKLAISPYPYMEACDIELYGEGETYTADTLYKLNNSYQGDELFFIVGSDSLKQMNTWYKPETIFDLCNIICAKREGEILDDIVNSLRDSYDADIHLLSDIYWHPINISSSKTRDNIMNSIYDGLDIRVVEYIKTSGLYSKDISSEQMLARLKIELSKHRYEHSISVANTAYDLAISHGYKFPEKAYLAGVLHDCGKPYAGALTHAAKGAEIAETYYNIKDQEILDAISSHTIGRPAMSELESIIFLADFIEPTRENFEELEEIRALSYIDYNRAIVRVIRSTIDYLNEKGQYVDEKTIDVYNYYKRNLN